ncbi:MAG TPA: IS630 family transposase, partial [Flavobacteriaceae bacterium]
LLKERLQIWTKERNDVKKKINWTFTKQDADKKLSKQYAP